MENFSPGVTTRIRRAVIDLPAMVQAIANNRRSGVLVIGEGAEACDYVFLEGMVCAYDAPGQALLARSLRGLGLVPPAALATHQADAVDDLDLARRLDDAELICEDALRDAIDCAIEESFAGYLCRGEQRFRFDDTEAEQPWVLWQRQLGISLQPTALLMEGLRRHERLRLIVSVGENGAALVKGLEVDGQARMETLF